VAENRRERYWMDSRQQLHIMRDIDGRGWELLAIYHSHPHSPARPSKTDKDLAGYPDAVYVIVSLKDGERPEARAFRIDGQRAQEEELLVED
jgi:proteasome lid subunit RPN8/RPN11